MHYTVNPAVSLGHCEKGYRGGRPLECVIFYFYREFDTLAVLQNRYLATSHLILIFLKVQYKIVNTISKHYLY